MKTIIRLSPPTTPPAARLAEMFKRVSLRRQAELARPTIRPTQTQRTRTP